MEKHQGPRIPPSCNIKIVIYQFLGNLIFFQAWKMFFTAEILAKV